MYKLARIAILSIVLIVLSASLAVADSRCYLPLLFRQARVMPQGFVILNHTYFSPFSGSSDINFMGEAQNNTGHIANGWVNVVLRNAQGAVVKQDYMSLWIFTTNPGQRTPFRMIFLDCPDFASYDIYVTYEMVDQGPKMLESSEVTGSFSSYDSYVVQGKVHNPYPVTVPAGEAAISLSDAQGQIVGVGMDFLPSLHPGETTNFAVEVFFYKGRPDQTSVASYQLWVYDD